ncbi:MAG TPA: PTS sugar transporter subunit IIC [Myxococcales bacterium]|jgi:mannose/fructose/N-acetylgalactosamine-specific phosphotransferase system component IIC
MERLLPSAIVAVVAGLAAVERKGAFQLMLSRPLVLAPILGLLFGDGRAGLLLGVPLELLFLGGVNLGGNLPHNETLLAAALTAMVVPAGAGLSGGVDAPLAVLGLALLFPLAVYGRKLERASEQRNAEIAAEALRRVQAGDASAIRLNLRGLFLPFGVTFGICALASLCAPLLGWLRAQCGPAAVLALSGAWHAVLAVSAACAIRAIRDSRAPFFAGLSAAVLVAAAVAFRGAL